ncbi:hypothetical protein [Mycoplasmopsis arginini]|uniref:hypothetical protein n=1 Tax=Mycoplasmopsis arginini TaxID=2094 RepID=UPI000764C55E|nr:hypothetical protein [Mycoplasmopsis arginini]
MTRLNKILFILGGLSAAALPVTAIACNDTQKPTPTPPTPPTPQPQSQPENPGAGTETPDTPAPQPETPGAGTETPDTPAPQPENPGAGTEEGGNIASWISDYNAKVKEAEELLTQLKKDSSKYSTIISHLEEELAAAKAAVSLQNSGKEEYQIATKGLTEEIAKATEVKKDIDSGQ